MKFLVNLNKCLLPTWYSHNSGLGASFRFTAPPQLLSRRDSDEARKSATVASVPRSRTSAIKINSSACCNQDGGTLREQNGPLESTYRSGFQPNTVSS
jgi:hypothetical protein